MERQNGQAHAAAADERAPLLPRRGSAAEPGDVDIPDDARWPSELWWLTKFSLPLITTYLLQYSFFVIIIVIAGHLSADDLAAASIGATTMNVVGMSVMEGMATALDTLCAQAYGSGNKTGVGLHIQKMLLLMALSFIPIGAIWICSPWILPLFVQQHDLAYKAGIFMIYSLIGLPGYAAFEAVKRFLQAQGDCNVSMVVLIICAPINAALSWALAFPCGLGLGGAALGAALSNNLRIILLLLYIVSPFGKWSHECWGGFSRDALRKWGPMLGLSLAGTGVQIGEWAAFEILTFSTSRLSTNHLAAQTIMTTAMVIIWHIPFSVSVGVTTRIGHLIGGGLVDTAKRASKMYAVVFVVVGFFDFALLYFFRYPIVSVFSNDQAIRDLASRSMWLPAAFAVLDSIANGASGLLRGLGKQEVAAYIVFTVNYLGAVPLAIWLELGSPHWGIDGVWIGFGWGVGLTIALECLYMWMLNWRKVSDEVKLREEVDAAEEYDS